MRVRRYQVQYGMGPNQKGYIVTDAGDPPAGVNTTNVIFTTDSKGDAIEFADRKNAEYVQTLQDNSDPE